MNTTDHEVHGSAAFNNVYIIFYCNVEKNGVNQRSFESKGVILSPFVFFFPKLIFGKLLLFLLRLEANLRHI